MREDGVMSSALPVRRAEPGDREAVVATIVRAFTEDPLVRWFFPDDTSYESRASAFFGYLFDIRVRHGEVHVAGDGASTALWSPPGGVTMDPAEQDRRWETQVMLGGEPAEIERIDLFDATVEDMRPPGHYWYLGVLATDPARRGAGFARAVLNPVLQRADDDRTPVFLETGTPENLPFYERFGFVVLAEDRVADGPQVWALRRSPVT